MISVDRDDGSWDSAEHRFGAGRAIMNTEKDLIDAFQRTVHEDFPNPERIDCPGQDQIVRFAANPADLEFVRLLAHIRQCAPCFDELKKVRLNRR